MHNTGVLEFLKLLKVTIGLGDCFAEGKGFGMVVDNLSEIV